MRDPCLSTLGRVTLAGAILLGGIVMPAAAEDETQPCNPNGQAIAYGDVRAGCAIEVATDQDIFTLQGAAGDHVAIVVTRTAGPGIVCAEVRGTDNSLLAGPACVIPGVRFNIGPLSQTGVHRIIVFEQNNDSTVSFNLSVERLTPPGSPVVVAPGDDVLTGREILPAADLDAFAFDAAAGDIVRVAVTRTAGSGVVCAEVRAPDNSVLAALTCVIPGVQFDLGPLTQSGVHQIIVSEQSNDATLTYNLSLNCLSLTCEPRLPNCSVTPSYASNALAAGNTLTLDFIVSTPEPVEWHMAMLAVGSSFTLWKIPLPEIEPPASFPVPIPDFPALGTIGFLSTFTTESGLTCTDLKLIDTGSAAANMTPALLRRYFPDR